MHSSLCHSLGSGAAVWDFPPSFPGKHRCMCASCRCLCLIWSLKSYSMLWGNYACQISDFVMHARLIINYSSVTCTGGGKTFELMTSLILVRLQRAGPSRSRRGTYGTFLQKDKKIIIYLFCASLISTTEGLGFNAQFCTGTRGFFCSVEHGRTRPGWGACTRSCHVLKLYITILWETSEEWEKTDPLQNVPFTEVWSICWLKLTERKWYSYQQQNTTWDHGRGPEV